VTCEEARPLIEIYLDDELDARTSPQVEAHLAGCAVCGPRRDRLLELRARAREHLVWHEPSKALLRRLSRALRPRTSRPAILSAAGAAATLALAVFIFSRPGDTLATEVADAHVRSLLAGHTTDVATSDQHVVKPWFQGKLDFSVPVRDLSERGFPLVGGRLDYLGDRLVAAIVYRRGAHVINLFVWPSSSAGPVTPRRSMHHGFVELHWTQQGLDFWLVGDVRPADLETLAELLLHAAP
jgi:anti-sigma factor RsiW